MKTAVTEVFHVPFHAFFENNSFKYFSIYNDGTLTSSLSFDQFSLGIENIKHL